MHPLSFTSTILLIIKEISYYVKVKQSRYRPGVAQRKLRFPDFMTTAQDGGKVVSLTKPAAFTPRKCSWYSFLLEAESTPGSQCDRKDFMSMKNSNDTSWDRTSDLPICSTTRFHIRTITFVSVVTTVLNKDRKKVNFDI